MAYRFAKVRPDQLRALLTALGEDVDKPRPKFMEWLFSRATTGDRLPPDEKAWLIDYLGRDERTKQVSPRDVTVVQFTYRQCCNELGWHDTQVSRCKKWAIDKGVLVEITAGIKGHGSLVAFAPIAQETLTKRVGSVSDNTSTRVRDGPNETSAYC